MKAANKRYLRTSEIAIAVGVHPNTVRLYEVWGLLPPVERSAKGYRLFTIAHREQMCLARLALRGGFAEGGIRARAIQVVKTAAVGDLAQAREKADDCLEHIRQEQIRAEEALQLIRDWLAGEPEEPAGTYLKRKDVTGLLGVSIDVLRNWERNGLVAIPRNPDNGYRVYRSWEISRLKIIRALRAANYSMMAVYRMLRHIDRGGREDVREVIDTPEPGEDIISAADCWITTLTVAEQGAREVIAQLEKMIRLAEKEK